MTIEEEFGELIAHLREKGMAQHLQRELKTLPLQDVPAEFRRSLSFWQSLSGPSRNLMFDVSQGRRLHKKFGAEGKSRVPMNRNYGQWPRMPKIP